MPLPMKRAEHTNSRSAEHNNKTIQLPNTAEHTGPSTPAQQTQPNTRSSHGMGPQWPNPRTQLPNIAEHAFTSTQPQATRDLTEEAKANQNQQRMCV